MFIIEEYSMNTETQDGTLVTIVQVRNSNSNFDFSIFGNTKQILSVCSTTHGSDPVIPWLKE